MVRSGLGRGNETDCQGLWMGEVGVGGGVEAFLRPPFQFQYKCKSGMHSRQALTEY